MGYFIRRFLAAIYFWIIYNIRNLFQKKSYVTFVELWKESDSNDKFYKTGLIILLILFVLCVAYSLYIIYT